MRWDLDGGAAVVTGAGGGIGRAVALELARQGANVAALDLDLGKAQETAAEAERAGVKAYAARADVSDSEQVAEAIGSARRAVGDVAYLVNIAGYFQAIQAEDLNDADWRRLLAVHLDGSFYCSRAVLPGMIARRTGAIVNIASIQAFGLGFGYVPPAVHYAAAKAGIVGLTKALARETGPHGVRVNAVAPTAVDTPLWREGRTGAELEARIAARVKVIPLGRLAQARDVANAVLFLLSPASGFITGHVLNVTGGELMS